jgi:hypothetical protein
MPGVGGTLRQKTAPPLGDRAASAKWRGALPGSRGRCVLRLRIAKVLAAGVRSASLPGVSGLGPSESRRLRPGFRHAGCPPFLRLVLLSASRADSNREVFAASRRAPALLLARHFRDPGTRVVAPDLLRSPVAFRTVSAPRICAVGPTLSRCAFPILVSRGWLWHGRGPLLFARELVPVDFGFDA